MKLGLYIKVWESYFKIKFNLVQLKILQNCVHFKYLKKLRKNGQKQQNGKILFLENFIFNLSTQKLKSNKKYRHTLKWIGRLFFVTFSFLVTTFLKIKFTKTITLFTVFFFSFLADFVQFCIINILNGRHFETLYRNKLNFCSKLGLFYLK